MEESYSAHNLVCCFCNEPVMEVVFAVCIYGYAHSFCFKSWMKRGTDAVKRFRPKDRDQMFFTRPGHVFVQTPDWHWFQKPLVRITPTDNVILCIFPGCGKHAVQLDSFWPYYAEMTRCAEHTKTPTPAEVLEKLEERNQA